ncbi:MAG TPA: FAD:protein FMN transferase [Frankiaceae bacterium]|nr:FAD:protein FMN transferase [Frankiaceae bacterium]
MTPHAVEDADSVTADSITADSDTAVAAAEWRAIGTTARIVTTLPETLDDACELVVRELAALDLACSRFRPDSEVRRLEQAEGETVSASPLLVKALDVALVAARRTNGDVDPTLGTALVDLGYDETFDVVRRRSAGGRVRVVRKVPGWRRVEVDIDRGTVRVPPGTLLDLGATAKAWAADRCAGQIVARFGGGVLVSLGGDIATAGAAPSGGWSIQVQDRPDAPNESSITVRLPGGSALATSSTSSRSWIAGRTRMHHVLDPRSLRPVPAVWRYVSVAAADCVTANTASTAALVRGRAAPDWLAGLGLPARLVAADGAVVRVGSWPSEALS